MMTTLQMVWSLNTLSAHDTILLLLSFISKEYIMYLHTDRWC